MVGGGGDAGGGFPEFTYTGTHQLINDGKVNGKQNWRLKLLTSGTLTFKKSPGNIQVFLVGGGGAGAGGGGGGGGYTKTVMYSAVKETPYSIIIGAGGTPWPNVATSGSTSAFGSTVNGGTAGEAHGRQTGGDGGSGGGGLGGVGGSNGANGASSAAIGGNGQGTTTREFGDVNGDLYSGGGGGGGGSKPAGGAGGGGHGGHGNAENRPASGTQNTGGGGGGNYDGLHAPGGSGVVVIRNSRV